MGIHEYQEFVIDTLVNTIDSCKSKNYSGNMFSLIAKDLKCLINHYASMYKYNDTYENLWQDSKFEFYGSLLMSDNAHRIFKDKKGSYIKYKDNHKGKNEELLYWEHITPNEIVWKRICLVYEKFWADNIEETTLRHEVEKCFFAHKLVLLTKKESKDLDKKWGRNGQRIDAIKDANPIVNIAAYRIKKLFEDDIVKCMWVGKKQLFQNDIVDENGNFVNEGLAYFTSEDFVLNNK